MILAALPVTPILPPPEKLAGIGLRIGVVLLLAFIVQRLFFMLWGRFSRIVVRAADDDRAAAQRVKSLTEVVRHLTTAAVLLFTLIYVLELLGWDVKPLLAGAGIIGVAVGFGAQSLVRDWIAGAFILTENQFGLGDVIEVNGRAATVEAIHLRSTQLRDSQGFVYFVPNGEFKTVVNRTAAGIACRWTCACAPGRISTAHSSAAARWRGR